MNNYLVKYIYDYKGPRTNNPKMIGCIISIGKNQVGVAICSTRDTFRKYDGKILAAGRAFFNDPIPDVTFRKITDNCGNVFNLSNYITDQMKNMTERSVKYFK